MINKRSKLFADTSPEAEEVLLDLLRRKTAAEKMRMVNQLNTRMRRAVLCGLQQRHPQMTEKQLKRKLADILLGEELATKVYGKFPEA